MSVSLFVFTRDIMKNTYSYQVSNYNKSSSSQLVQGDNGRLDVYSIFL